MTTESNRKFRPVPLPSISWELQWLQQACAWCLTVTEPDSSKSPTKFIICKCLTNSAAKNQHQELLLGDTWRKQTQPPSVPRIPHGDGKNSWEDTLSIQMKGRRNNFKLPKGIFPVWHRECGDWFAVPHPAWRTGRTFHQGSAREDAVTFLLHHQPVTTLQVPPLCPFPKHSDVHREEKQTENKRPISNWMPPSPLLLQWALFCLWLMWWGGIKAENYIRCKIRKATNYIICKKPQPANYLLSSFLNKIHQPDHKNDKHWLCPMYLNKIKASMMIWGGKLGILNGKQCWWKTQI